MRELSIALLSTALVGWAGQVHATDVDLELAFLLDGSSSVTAFDFARQLQAYRNIFRNDFFNRYVAALPNQRLAVAAYQFGGTNTSNAFQTLAGWTIITDNATAASFATLLEGKTRIGGSTPLGFAIERTADAIFANGIDSAWSTINLTSDGDDFPPLSLAITPLEASDYARCAGTIDPNTCPVDQGVVLPGGVKSLNSISPGTDVPEVFTEINYGTNITGSTRNAFLYGTIDDFENALAFKLANEIGRTPEPSGVAGALAIGTLGAIGFRGKRRR
jgi:hypothetical protein